MDQPIQSASRPRAHSRTFSRSSDKSSDRASIPLSQSEKATKARRDSLLRGESKANPNAALAEVQPATLATLEQTTLDSIRGMQHKDATGNIITEPDLSNPTRPRWERPLDTIRSFEKAIDGGYKRRSATRSESYDASNQYASRRTSYIGGPTPARQSQSQVGSYYGNGRADGYYDQNGQNPNGPPRQRYNTRYPSESAVGRQNGGPGYGQHGYHQSHDTVNTGNGSDSTGPWGNSTHPSSENSSPDRFADRVKAPRTPNGMESYGHDGFGGAPIPEEYASDDSNGFPQGARRAHNGYGAGYPQHNGAPAPPTHSAPRQTIQLGGGGGGGSDSTAAFAAQPGKLPSSARPQEEKKKSWLKRRFSKHE